MPLKYYIKSTHSCCPFEFWSVDEAVVESSFLFKEYNLSCRLFPFHPIGHLRKTERELILAMALKSQVSDETIQVKVEGLQRLLEEIKRSGNPYLDEIQCQKAEKAAHEISLLTKPARFVGYEMAMMVSAIPAHV